MEWTVRKCCSKQRLFLLCWLLFFTKLAVLNKSCDGALESRPPRRIGRSFTASDYSDMTFMDPIQDVLLRFLWNYDALTFSQKAFVDVQFVLDRKFANSRIDLTDRFWPSGCCVGHDNTKNLVFSCLSCNFFKFAIWRRPSFTDHVDMCVDIIFFCEDTVFTHVELFSSGLLDRTSATTRCFPGENSAFGLNLINLINNLWHRSGVSWRSLLLMRGTRGLWSVSSLNDSSLTKYLPNFSEAQTAPRHSFSIYAYPRSVVLEQYATGFWIPSWSCSKTPSKP